MNYNLKLAFRNIFRNGIYSAINIIGLSTSLLACIFILLWVKDELSYDRFHKDAKDIYTVVANFKSDGGNHTVGVSSGLFAPTAMEVSGNVTEMCRILGSSMRYIKAGDIKIDFVSSLYTDSTFFSFFNFPLILGDKQNILRGPTDAVLSKTLSEKLFGSENTIGKIINMDGMKDLTVVGIMEDMPSNTTLPLAGIVVPFDVNPDPYYSDILNTWDGCEFLSYLKIMPGTNIDELAKNVTAKQTVMDGIRHFTMQPLVNRHLYTLEGHPAGIRTVQMFIVIAIIILIISSINYVNLVTARASKRHKEIGLKKIIGAKKQQLFFQLMLEAVLLFLIAICLAILLVILLLPAFNQLAGKEIHPSWLEITGLCISILLIVCLIAGIYPALLISSFKPINMIQGALNRKGNTFFRKILIITQFTASIILIIGTITLQSQMKYIRQKNLGFDKEHIILSPLLKMAGQYETVKAELMKHPSVLGVSTASESIISVGSGHSIYDWEGKISEGQVSVTQERIDSSFMSLMNFTLVEGSGFKGSEPNQYILNETAIRALGMEDPVGKWINSVGKGRIVGVVKDFHFNSLHNKIVPLIMYQQTPQEWWKLYIKTSAKDAGKTIEILKDIWGKFNPDYDFSYWFLDESFDNMYKSDVRIGKLFGIFSIIAILISCLGLLGLVIYTAETKKKEIGIRKVLGADIKSLILMIGKEFLILVGIAIIIAFPIAWYISERILNNFTYRISVSWWIFLLAALITILLTLFTVGIQAYKAATSNPVDSIKTE